MYRRQQQQAVGYVVLLSDRSTASVSNIVDCCVDLLLNFAGYRPTGGPVYVA